MGTIAKAYLRALRIELRQAHTSTETGNFSIGRGSRLPYHILRMRRMTGDSKETVTWCLTLTQAREQVVSFLDGHRASQDETEWTYYIHDIRSGNIYRS